MSEVDRLSNSGLYPALPIQDRQGKGGGAGEGPPDGREHKPDPNASASAAPKTPRPPKSIIDDYA
jgi:hypothetical protein